MDTKNLYDWAVEADLDLRDSEGYYDAQAVWIDAIMQHPESLADFWVDWCYDQPEKIKEMLVEIGRADSDLQTMANSKSLRGCDTLQFAYGNSMIGRNASAGEMMRRMIRDGLTAYTENMAEEWWCDVQGYAADMQEGAREDYEYERYKDRQLEERE